MSVSTDGQLTFGYKLQSEEEDDVPPFLVSYYDEEDGSVSEAFDKMIHVEAGLTESWRDDMSEKEMSDYFAARREAEKNYPVQLVYHCSYDYPMHIVAPNHEAAHFSASRGYPVDLGEAIAAPPQAAIAAFIAWCIEHDVPCKAAPTWHLSSMWG